jgi:hypothetical protein
MSQFEHSRQAHLQPYAPFSWSAALWASVIAGAVFAMLDIGANWALRGTSPWVLLRMIGAIVLGPGALSPSDTSDTSAMLVAIAVHLALSVVYGTFLALVIPKVDATLAILVGGLYGLALYYINFYGFNIFSPWFAGMRDWVSIASHFVFGAVLACAYTAINARKAARPGEPIGSSQLRGPRPPYAPNH